MPVEGCYCFSAEDHLDDVYHVGELYTKSKVPPPWGQVKCAFSKNRTAYLKHWPLLSKLQEANLLNIIADFYLYEHLAMHPHVSNGVGMLAVQAQRDLVITWAPVIKEYLHSAIVSELRHCWSFTRTMSVATVEESLYGWAQICRVYGKAQAAEMAVELFNRQAWVDAYGGRRYGKIATVLQWGESGLIGGRLFTDHLFLDSVFSLEHNTGTVFSKLNKLRLHCDIEDVLEAHGKSDIQTISAHASSEALSLWAKLGD